MARKIEKFKGSDIMFRTYNFGELMGSVTKTELTPKQATDLKSLLEKITLTEKQAQERDRLIAKRDAEPALNQGGKTLVQNIFREVVRGTYKQNFSNKYTEKGNSNCENTAIDRIAKVNGWGSFLNANKLGIELKDHIGVAHPDAIKTNIRIGFDAKSSFTDETFPLFDNELKETNYIWQAKRLAMMANFDKWFIAYSLENTPEHLVVKHAWELWRKSGNDGELTDSFLDDVRGLHTFDHLADWERVKTFEIAFTNEDRLLIEKRAQMARNYFDELMDEYLIKTTHH
jgi:hypothetical protein